MFGIGPLELVAILVVALLIFGPAKLPELARTLGRGMAEFRRASSELRQSLTVPPEETPATPPPPQGPADQMASAPIPEVPAIQSPAAPAANDASPREPATTTPEPASDDDAKKPA
jgi:sec-independent protein translocase protein TatA